MSSQPGYDAIVIGSGMGGLAFASIMAKLRKWRVLVLERHFKIGGFTHTFTRPGGWSWDVGLHYVGEMGEGMMERICHSCGDRVSLSKRSVVSGWGSRRNR